MIRGVGTDLIKVSRIEASLERYGDKFAKKVLNEDEYESFLASTHKANFLAKRFAVKEAVSKSLGTGIAQGVSWKDISVEYTSLGAPIAILQGEAKQRLNSISAKNVSISISDEGDLVTAFAVAD